jgi:hypothetical protein
MSKRTTQEANVLIAVIVRLQMFFFFKDVRNARVVILFITYILHLYLI